MKRLHAAPLVLLCGLVVLVAGSGFSKPEVTFTFQNTLTAEGEVGHKLFVPLEDHNEFEHVKVVYKADKPPVRTILYKFSRNNGPDLNIHDAPRKEYTLAVMASLDDVTDVHFLDVRTLLEYKNGHDLQIVDGEVLAEKCVAKKCTDVRASKDAPKFKAETMNLVVVSRDAEKVLRVYINGVETLSFEDSENDFVLSNRIFLFQDDFWGEQTSAGFMASLRIFKTALTGEEVEGILTDAERALMGKSFGKSGLEVKTHLLGSDEKNAEKEDQELKDELDEKNNKLSKDESELAALRRRLTELKEENRLKAAAMKLKEKKAEQVALAAELRASQMEIGWSKANATIADLTEQLAATMKRLNMTEEAAKTYEHNWWLAQAHISALQAKLNALKNSEADARRAQIGEKDALKLEIEHDTILSKDIASKDEIIADLMEKLRRANETIADLAVTGTDDEKILAYVKRVREVVEARREKKREEGEAGTAPDASVDPETVTAEFVGCSADAVTRKHSELTVAADKLKDANTSPQKCARMCIKKDPSFTHFGVRYGGLVCECATDEQLEHIEEGKCSMSCSDGSQCGSSEMHVFSYYKIVR